MHLTSSFYPWSCMLEHRFCMGCGCADVELWLGLAQAVCLMGAVVSPHLLPSWLFFIGRRAKQ